MTNEPQSDRQGGDGLPRGRADIKAAQERCAKRGDYETVGLLGTLATRDAAEGVGRIYTIEDIEALRKLQKSAPPKPAPDAMDICPRCGSSAPHMHPAVQHEGEVELCTHEFHLRPTNQNTPAYIAAVEAKRALAAGSRLWMAATAVALHRPLSKQVCHVPTPLMLELLDALLYSNSAPSGVRDAIRPSPAVATETGSDAELEERLLKQDARDMLRLIDRIADKIGLPHNEELSRDNFNAWLATPPVRGDREVEQRVISGREDWFMLAHELSEARDAYLNGMGQEGSAARRMRLEEILWNDKGTFIQVLQAMSLHVPPGAGERGSDAAEADRYFEMAGEFGNQLQTLAGVVQEAVDFLAERKHGNAARSPSHNARVILETALKKVSPSALPDRQAPHSSREGES